MTSGKKPEGVQGPGIKPTPAPQAGHIGGQTTLAGIFGEIVWLLSQSSGHKFLFIADLEWFLMPALMLGQFRTFRDGERIVGLAMWAHLSEEVEARVNQGIVKLAPSDWKSGDRTWLVELITPFGGVEAMIEDLRKTALKGHSFSFHVTGPDGQRQIRTLPVEG